MTIEQEIITLLRNAERPMRIPGITRHVSTQHECRVGRILRDMIDRGIVRIIETHSAGTAGYMLSE